MSRIVAQLLLVGLAASFIATVPEPAAADSATTALALGSHEPEGEQLQSLLLREIVRQAVLISAREELARPLAMPALRKRCLWPTKETSNGSMPRSCFARTANTASLHASPDPNSEVLFESEIEGKKSPIGTDIEPHLINANALARGKLKEFLAARPYWQTHSRQQVGSGSGRHRATAARDELHFTIQRAPPTARVRTLRGLVAGDGSGDRAGLCQPGAADRVSLEHGHKVFKARALLYAYRLTELEQSNAWSLWHRGYAYCARRTTRSGATRPVRCQEQERDTAQTKPPAWLPLLEAYLSFNDAALKKHIQQDELRELAALLSLPECGKHRLRESNADHRPGSPEGRARVLCHLRVDGRPLPRSDQSTFHDRRRG